MRESLGNEIPPPYTEWLEVIYRSGSCGLRVLFSNDILTRLHWSRH